MQEKRKRIEGAGRNVAPTTKNIVNVDKMIAEGNIQKRDGPHVHF